MQFNAAIVPTLILLICSAPIAQASKKHAGSAGAPVVTHVGRVAPNVLAIEIESQMRSPGKVIPYHAEPGDTVAPGLDRWLTRNGKPIGAIIGPAGSELMTFDGIKGHPLDERLARTVEFYHVEDGDGNTIRPVKISRKSKPIDECRVGPWEHHYPQRHFIYLTFDTDLSSHGEYEIRFNNHTPPMASVSVNITDTELRSEAIHVNHVGFDPNDRVKVGYLSLWMGDGGPKNYEWVDKFRLVNNDGDTVFESTVDISLAKHKTEAGRGRNYNATDVYRLDFSPFDKEGQYRIVIDGIGSSYPFNIRSNITTELFKTAMAGLLHHRSGIELSSSFSTYTRPRTMVPGEGDFRVYESGATIVRQPSGEVSQHDIFKFIVNEAREEQVSGAWGGYMDAGDWDRRAHHLYTTRLLLELFELRATFYENFALQLPDIETSNKLPDLLDEAVFNLALYRRIQTTSGGVRGWIESADHPRYGEVSWLESLDVYATDPEPYASYMFASTAARFSRLVEKYSKTLSEQYRDSSIRAFAWAEKALVKGDWDSDFYLLRDSRNLAAVELLRLTDDMKYHEVFLTTTAFTDPEAPLQVWQKWHQREAAFSYLRYEGASLSQEVKRNAKVALLNEADQRARTSLDTGFGWSNDPMGWVGWGQQTSFTFNLSLVRAHYLTGHDDYCDAIKRSMQFMMGANPLNMTFTTGVGHIYPRNPLHIDTHFTNREAPIGITTYGPADPIPHGKNNRLYWATQKIVDVGAIYPDVRSWPPLESYWDIFMHPQTSEYTVMQNLGPVAYVWGYIAAQTH